MSLSFLIGLTAPVILQCQANNELFVIQVQFLLHQLTLQKGTNPSRILRGPDEILLEVGKPQKLLDGDILELVVTMFPFYVEMEAEPAGHDEEKSGKQHF